MHYIKNITDELMVLANPDKVEVMKRFFQVFPGGYAEHDDFIGVSVPDQRAVAGRYFKNISLDEIASLLEEPVHEFRLTAVFMLVLKYEKAGTDHERKQLVDIYLDKIGGINNWDLVDSSAHKILGPYLMEKDKSLLYEFAQSGDLWKQRIAVITTFYFIRERQYADSLFLALILLEHKHDLIHKAVGWMLREIGNRDYGVELRFLKEHYRRMPRTMLRYAIEKFDEDVRQQFLKGSL